MFIAYSTDELKHLTGEWKADSFADAGKAVDSWWRILRSTYFQKTEEIHYSSLTETYDTTLYRRFDGKYAGKIRIHAIPPPVPGVDYDVIDHDLPQDFVPAFPSEEDYCGDPDAYTQNLEAEQLR